MMAPAPKISVIICTFNRVKQLGDAIGSLLNQALDKSQYEIVVVNNASTDGTAGLIKSIQSLHVQPEILLIPEPRQGLGYARNTGFKHARGTYTAFIDDDCLATKDWLQSLLDCFENV